MTVSLMGPDFCKFPFKYVFAELTSYSFILTPIDIQKLGVKVRNMKMDFYHLWHLSSGRAMNTNDENL